MDSLRNELKLYLLGSKSNWQIPCSLIIIIFALIFFNITFRINRSIYNINHDFFIIIVLCFIIMLFGIFALLLNIPCQKKIVKLFQNLNDKLPNDEFWNGIDCYEAKSLFESIYPLNDNLKKCHVHNKFIYMCFYLVSMALIILVCMLISDVSAVLQGMIRYKFRGLVEALMQFFWIGMFLIGFIIFKYSYPRSRKRELLFVITILLFFSLSNIITIDYNSLENIPFFTANQLFSRNLLTYVECLIRTMKNSGITLLIAILFINYYKICERSYLGRESQIIIFDKFISVYIPFVDLLQKIHLDNELMDLITYINHNEKAKNLVSNDEKLIILKPEFHKEKLDELTIYQNKINKYYNTLLDVKLRLWKPLVTILPEWCKVLLNNSLYHKAISCFD